MGAAWAAGVPIIGLYAKGEDLGLMRKMALHWVDRIPDLLDRVDVLALQYLRTKFTGEQF